MSKPGQLAFSGMVLFCAAILVACSSNSKPPQLTLSSLTIAPSNGEIYVSASLAGGVRSADHRGGAESVARPAVVPPPVTAICGKLQYTATAHYTNGNSTQVGIAVTWSSSNTSVASIDTTGLATGVGVGTTNIGATSMGIAATSDPLAVDQLNSISVSPSTSTAAPGGSQKFLATGNFTLATGSPGIFDVSSQVTWSSSNTNVATIDQTGNATAKATGVTTIMATSCDGGTVGQAVLNVGQPATTTLVVTPTVITIATGTTTLFTAMEMLGNGTIQAPQNPVTWLSGSPNVASIDANSGVALGLTAGTSAIIATETVTGFTGSATLAVQPAAARFAYVADAQGGAVSSGTISGYSVDVTSATPLTPLPGSPVAAGNPQQVLLHPSGDLMYYIDGAGSLHVDDVNSTDGSFSESGQAPTRASTTTTGSFNVGVIDPTGRFIYVTSGVDNTIYGFSIAQTGVATPATNGALTPIPSFNPYTDASLNSPTWIMTDRAGKYVYVVNSGTPTTPGNTVSEYSIDQTTGKLSPLSTATVPTGMIPIFGTTDVNGHLYVANEGPPQTVSSYSINSSTGELTSVGADTPITGATSTINVITDPTGKYLYVLDSTGGPPPPTAPPSHVFAYDLNPATGVIGAQIGTSQLTGNSPTGMAIDPTGALLAIDNNFDNTLSLFTIGATSSATPGGLTPLTPPTVATDNQPLFVVFYTAASGQ
jgi:6-phosphogluconolactonase (cycloisomerase 2 family)